MTPLPPAPRRTVLVDPTSQIPDRRASSKSQPPVEATRILSARKVDRLRAQVHQHKRAQRWRQVLRFVSWGAAGALAVAVGGILAGGLLPRLGSDVAQTESPSAVESRPPGLVTPSRGSRTAGSAEVIPAAPTGQDPGVHAEQAVRAERAAYPERDERQEPSRQEGRASSQGRAPASAKAPISQKTEGLVEPVAAPTAGVVAPSARAVSLAELAEEEDDQAVVIQSARRR